MEGKLGWNVRTNLLALGTIQRQ